MPEGLLRKPDAVSKQSQEAVIRIKKKRLRPISHGKRRSESFGNTGRSKPLHKMAKARCLLLSEFFHKAVNTFDSFTNVVNTVGIGYTNKALACIAERSARYTGYTPVSYTHLDVYKRQSCNLCFHKDAVNISLYFFPYHYGSTLYSCVLYSGEKTRIMKL